jgi:hypothetical protein
MPPATLARRLGPARAAPVGLAVGAGLAVAALAAVDPEGGHLPLCPSAALLGLDCPACGTLRGVHDLTRGRVLEALDHNLLLLVAVPAAVWLWWRWLRAAGGGSPARVAPPTWVVPALVGVAMTFMVLRNLPVDALGWLAAT